MKCPWCENKMQVGHLSGDGRSRLRFHPEGVRYNIGELLAGIGCLEAVTYKWYTSLRVPAHYCPRCKRMVIETEVTR